MKNYRLDKTVRVLGLTTAILVGAGSWFVGWSQSSPSNWEWETGKRAFIEKNMYLDQAACQSIEDKKLQQQYFDVARNNFQHSLHVHGLKKRRYEKMGKAFLKQERDYVDIFERLTATERAAREAVRLLCFKVNLSRHPEMAEQTEKVIQDIEIKALARKNALRPLTSETFAQLYVNWWGAKRNVLQDLTASGLSHSDYLAKRYHSITVYRHALDKFFQQSLTNESSYSEFVSGIENIDSLFPPSGSVQKRWKSISRALKPWISKVPSTLHQEMGIVTGVLVNKETQAPAAGIPLILRNIPGKLTDVRYQTQSDEMGRFIFPHVAPGDYVLDSKLSFGPEGTFAYRSQGEILFIRMSEVLVIDFFLKYEKVTFKPASSNKE